MSVDYNLVILGGSLTARYAANFARCFKGRVALVEPRSMEASLVGLDVEGAIAQAFHYAAQQQHRLHVQSPQGNPVAASPLHSVESWASLRRWVKGLLIQELHYHSLPLLMSRGVDVVISDAPAEFCRRPRFGVIAEGRVLRAHAYLLAPGSEPVVPEMKGMSAVPYVTMDALLSLDTPPQGAVAIVADGNRGVELAQALARFGVRVTLVMRSPHPLSTCDWDMKQGVLATLEASGVEVVTEASVEQVSSIDGKTGVQVGSRAIATDHLILATERRPLITSLNLDAAGIPIAKGRVAVTPKLQTSHPRIYACGEAVAPQQDLTFSQYQAEQAVKNALFLSTRQWGDRPLVRTLHTVPPAAWVGVTEADAQRQFADDVVVLSVPMTDAFHARLMAESSGFLKMIVKRNGSILGAHGMGQSAAELVGAIALAMDAHLPLQKLASMPFPVSTDADVLNQLTLQWQTQQLENNRLWFNLLELVMNWQRDWSRG